MAANFRICRLTALISLCLGLQAAGTAITLTPGTLLVLEGGKKQLKSYDYSGNQLGALPLSSRINHPMGLAVIGKSIFILSDDGWVGKVDSETGLIFDHFPVAGTTSLGDNGTNLLVGHLTSNIVSEYTPSGEFVRSYLTVGPVTGLDGDASGFFVGTYSSGNVVRYDRSGAMMFSIPTGVGSGSISGLGADFADGAVWIASGFGDGKLRQFSFTGRLLRQFGGPDFVTGLEVIRAKRS